MSRIWLLTNMLLKNSSRGWYGQRGGARRSLLLLFLLAASFFPLVYGYVELVVTLYDMLAPLGQESVLLGLGLALASLAILFFALFYVFSVYYYAQDVEHLLPLPLKPADILGAKFFITLLYEYLTGAFFVLPLVLTYGVKSAAGPLYYLYAVVVFLALPVLPLVLASVFALLFMRVTSVGKRRDRSRLIGGLIALAAMLAVQVAIQRNTGGAETIEWLMRVILSDDHALLSLVTQLFPAARLGALALAEAETLLGFGYLLALLLVSAVAAAAFVLLGDRIYLKGVMGISETAARRKRASADQFRKRTGLRSPLLAFAAKEWKLLLRTPAYFLNCVLATLLLPVLVFIPLLSRSEGLAVVQAWGRVLENDPAAAGFGVAVAFALALFLGGANSVSATAVSRDGKVFFVNKYLPIPRPQILVAKAIPGTMLGVLGLLILCAAAGMVLQLSAPFLALAFLASLPGIVFANLIGLIIDLKHPKLNWDAEHKAVKQNWNSLLALAPVVAAAIPTLLLARELEPSPYGISLALFTLFVALDAMLYWLLVKRGSGWLEEIEP